MKIFKKITIGKVMMWAVTAVLLSLVISVCIAGAQAAGGAPAPTSVDPLVDEAVNGMMKWFNVILQFLSAIFWPILLLIGDLLKNDILFGGEMGDRLQWIWMQIRNLVNIAFVVVLVGIALYNILGFTGNEKYKITSLLPKFAIALIAINFSFLACKIVLDATNVMTQAIFAIPYQHESSATFMTDLQKKICRTGMKTMISFCTAECSDSDTTNDPACAFSEKGKAYFARPDSNNLAIALAVYLGKITDQDFVKIETTANEFATTSSTNVIKKLSQLTINVIFSTVMYFVFGMSLLALFIVLLARLVVLWLIIALSPLIAIKLVLPDLTSGLGENLDLDKKFVGHAIAPIIVGLAFVIGYLMISAYQGAGLGPKGTEQIGMIASENTIISGIADLQSFIIAACAVAVVWLGTFAAADKTVAKSITDTIKSAGERAGKFIAKAPLYAPFVPIKSGDGEKDKSISVQSLLNTVQRGTEKFEAEFGKPLPIFGEKSSDKLVNLDSDSDRVNHFKDHTTMSDLKNFEPERKKSVDYLFDKYEGKNDPRLKSLKEAFDKVKNLDNFGKFLKRVGELNTSFGGGMGNIEDYIRAIEAVPTASSSGKISTPPPGAAAATVRPIDTMINHISLVAPTSENKATKALLEGIKTTGYSKAPTSADGAQEITKIIDLIKKYQIEADPTNKETIWTNEITPKITTLFGLTTPQIAPLRAQVDAALTPPAPSP